MLAVEAESLPAAALLLQHGGRRAVGRSRLVRRADEVDGRREIVGAGGGDDGGAGEKEFGQGRRARQAEVEGKVLGGEDEALQKRRRGADLREVGDGFGGFDQGEERDGWSRRLSAAIITAPLLRCECVGNDVRDERQVRSRVDFGDDDGRQVWGLELVFVSKKKKRQLIGQISPLPSNLSTPIHFRPS